MDNNEVRPRLPQLLMSSVVKKCRKRPDSLKFCVVQTAAKSLFMPPYLHVNSRNQCMWLRFFIVFVQIDAAERSLLDVFEVATSELGTVHKVTQKTRNLLIDLRNKLKIFALAAR